MQRMTKQRQAVLDELTRVSDFRSAQQIFEDLHGQGQRVGLATVYRSCTTHDHHHHLVCRECGFTEEIEQSQIESWVESVATAHGFSDVEHSLELFGVCGSCRAKS